MITDSSDGQRYFILYYPRIAGGSALANAGYSVQDLLYQPQGSYDLIDWTAPVTDVTGLSGGLSPPAGFETGSFRLSAPISGPLAIPRGFLRVKTELTGD